MFAIAPVRINLGVQRLRICAAPAARPPPALPGNSTVGRWTKRLGAGRTSRRRRWFRSQDQSVQVGVAVIRAASR